MEAEDNRGGHNTSMIKKNRKRPKSFLQKARKFGKSGRFGRGREVEKDTYDYFVGVLEQLGKGFFGQDGGGGHEDDEEEKAVFVENVFRQTEGEEASLCGNQLVSRVIERLLPMSGFPERLRFMKELSEDLRQISIDPFASHVLETLLVLATFDPKLQESGSSASSEFKEQCGNWVLRVARFAVNNLEEFSMNTYASHLVRTCLQCLAGTRPRGCQGAQRGQSGLKQKPSEEGRLLDQVELADKEASLEVILNAASKIEEVTDIKGFVMNQTSSGVLQTLLLTLGHLGLKRDLKRIWQLLDKKVFEGATIPDNNHDDEDQGEEDPEGLKSQGEQTSLLEHEPVCRLIEAALSAAAAAAPKVWSRISSSLFDGRLLSWARHPVGNFTLQKLIGSCSDKDKFEEWYSEELDDNLEAILASGHHGVVVSVAQAARRLNSKQAHFLVALMKSLHCYEPQQKQSQFAILLAHLSTWEAFFVETDESQTSSSPMMAVSIHGSLILQESFNFQKPIKVVSSFLETDPAKLCNLLSDPKGCHVTDSFMASQTIGEKSRDGLVRALQGKLVSMARSKHGSRSIDAMWARASGKAKEMMAHELSARLGDLSSDRFGSFVAQNLHLALFKRSKDDWRRAISDKAKIQNVADEFLREIVQSQAPSFKAAVDASQGTKKKNEDTNEVHDENLGPSTNKRDRRNPVSENEVIKAKAAEPAPPKKKAKSYLDDL